MLQRIDEQDQLDLISMKLKYMQALHVCACSTHAMHDVLRSLLGRSERGREGPELPRHGAQDAPDECVVLRVLAAGHPDDQPVVVPAVVRLGLAADDAQQLHPELLRAERVDANGELRHLLDRRVVAVFWASAVAARKVASRRAASRSDGLMLARSISGLLLVVCETTCVPSLYVDTVPVRSLLVAWLERAPMRERDLQLVV